MSGLGRGIAGLIVAAALGAGVSLPLVERGMPYALQPTGVQVTSTVRKSTSSVGSYVGEFNYQTGPGWSNRQVKRMATKRRN